MDDATRTAIVALLAKAERVWTPILSGDEEDGASIHELWMRAGALRKAARKVEKLVDADNSP